MKPTSHLKVAVIGGGAWGTALANHLARLHEVTQWVYEKDLVTAINQTHKNATYLPGIELDSRLLASNSLEQVLENTDGAFIAVPSQFFRTIIEQCAAYLKPSMVIVSCTKGVEAETGFTMCEIALDTLPQQYSSRLACISGPSFAKEVALGWPTALTVASDNEDLAIFIQQSISTKGLRLYTSPDLVGVELGGAIKNPLAIAAGMLAGLKLGQNSLAAMITRGLAEMSRLVRAKKGQASTLLGLAGIGDLMLTCTSKQSRNFTLGYRLSQGENLDEIIASTPAIAEGVVNTSTILSLAASLDVEMPIIESVYQVIYRHQTPWQAIDRLTSRDLKSELY